MASSTTTTTTTRSSSQINLSASSTSSANTSLSDFDDPDADKNTFSQIVADHDNFGTLNKLRRKLSHLDSIPHTPRVIQDIPNPNDASLDHNRLKTYGLAELQIEGDGNCQFRALADQLFHNPDYHRHVRKQVVKQLKNFRSLYEGYVPMKYGDYLKKMKRSREWGDHVTLQAAADRFKAKICLVTSFRDASYIEILPHDKNFTRESWLSFWSEVHYNSLYDDGDVPTRLPRKKHWLF